MAAYTNYARGHGGGARGGQLLPPTEPDLPFSSYICVVDIDQGTEEVTVRRVVPVDDRAMTATVEFFSDHADS